MPVTPVTEAQNSALRFQNLFEWHYVRWEWDRVDQVGGGDPGRAESIEGLCGG